MKVRTSIRLPRSTPMALIISCTLLRDVILGVNFL